jgi:hypothetical protein
MALIGVVDKGHHTHDIVARNVSITQAQACGRPLGHQGVAIPHRKSRVIGYPHVARPWPRATDSNAARTKHLVAP